MYIVIFTRHPEAFSFGASPRVSEEHMFPIFIYFSLTTLSTIGFGDITPLTLQARYATVAEGITGQFYLVVLVARVAGMQMSPAATAEQFRLELRLVMVAYGTDEGSSIGEGGFIATQVITERAGTGSAKMAHKTRTT